MQNFSIGNLFKKTFVSTENFKYCAYLHHYRHHYKILRVKKVDELNFKREIWKTGNSVVITVPKAFIESGLIKEGQTYLISIKEVENGKNSEECTNR